LSRGPTHSRTLLWNRRRSKLAPFSFSNSFRTSRMRFAPTRPAVTRPCREERIIETFENKYNILGGKIPILNYYYIFVKVRYVEHKIIEILYFRFQNVNINLP
jgi:hypothetical protein